MCNGLEGTGTAWQQKMKNKNELLLHSKTSPLADMNPLESPAVHNYESFYWVVSKLCPALNTNKVLKHLPPPPKDLDQDSMMGHQW